MDQASHPTPSALTSAAISAAVSSQKHKENHQISSDILDDLSSRFIINVPNEERSDFIRICFQIELAHWFYLDFYCSAEDTRLVPCGIKQFAFHIFHHIPFLKEHLHRLNDIMNEFKLYKMSVPTYGAILMTADQQRVLLVQSFLAKSSWGFPKGKVNEDEEPLHCACREVYEETGFDITPLIRPDAYIEGVLNYQYTRLYIVPNVPADTVFAPRTRMEIRACTWFRLDLLPTHKMDPVCREKLGINANSFFMIMPFVKRLKRWVVEQRMNGNGGRSSSKQQLQQQQLVQQQQQQQRRQRHKSLGDLDGMKAATGGAPANGSQSNNTKQLQAQQQQLPASSQTTTYHDQHLTQQQQTSTTTTVTASVVSSNNTQRPSANTARGSGSNPTTTTTINNAKPTAAVAKPANFKRQLFTLQQQQQSTTTTTTTTVATETTTVPPPHHSNPLAVAQRVMQQSAAANGGVAATVDATATGSGSPRSLRKHTKKRRPITSFLNGLNGDPAVQKWKHFAFVVRPELVAPWA